MRTICVLPAFVILIAFSVHPGPCPAAGEAEEKAAAEPAGEEAAAEPAGEEEAAELAGEEAAAGPGEAEVAGKGARAKVVAGAKSYQKNAMEKFNRGAINFARASTEFYFQPREAARVSGKKIAYIYPGLGEAIGMFFTRFIGGSLEMATFAVPFPNGWQPLLAE